MAASTIRVIKKHLKAIEEINSLLKKAECDFICACDTNGKHFGSNRKDDVEGAREAVEGEAIDALTNAKEKITILLAHYGC